jgi:colanic acid biosynthesis glycosyl transferase WcaI
VLMSVVSRLRRARLIIVVHDVYPDVLYATGLMPVGSVAGRLLDRLATGALRRAERVIVIGRDMKRRIEAKLGGSSEHVVFIPNWADPDIVPGSMPGADANRPLVVQYSGNMGVTHPVETLLDCAAALQRDGVNARLEVFGWGLKLPAFRGAVQTRGLANLSLGERCARAKLGARLASADVVLVLMRHGMAGISVPCRFYNVLAAGRPVIVAAESNSEIALVVREHGLGWVVEPEDCAALTAAVADAAARRDALGAMGERAGRVGTSEYAFTAALERYRQLIDSTLAG